MPQQYWARRRRSGFSCSSAGSCRQGERKARATSQIALYPHPSAKMLDDLATDMQSQAAAMRLVGERVAHLMELAEDGLVMLGADAPPVVANVDPQGAVALDGHRRNFLGQARLDLDVLLPEQLIHRGESVRDDLLHIDLRLRPIGL